MKTAMRKWLREAEWALIAVENKVSECKQTKVHDFVETHPSQTLAPTHYENYDE